MQPRACRSISRRSIYSRWACLVWLHWLVTLPVVLLQSPACRSVTWNGSCSVAMHLTSCTVAATCVLIKQGELLVANLGDSRAVASVGGVVKQLTQDHNTSNPRERERVTAMGGVIKDNRVGGVLMPTRLLWSFFNSENEEFSYRSIHRRLKTYSTCLVIFYANLSL